VLACAMGETSLVGVQSLGHTSDDEAEKKESEGSV